MSIITQEDLFEYQVKKALKKYKKWMDTNATGQDLSDDIWRNKEVLGEIMFELIHDVLGEDIFEEE